MKRTASNQAFTLIETLVYVAVLGVVTTLAYPVFHRFLKGSHDLQRNADDIERAIHAGERWRDDVRHATAAPWLVGTALHIPQAAGEVVYSFGDGMVWRGTVPVLRHVQASGMQADARQQIEAWRWELELAGCEKTVRIRPLFTFEAVARRQP